MQTLNQHVPASYAVQDCFAVSLEEAWMLWLHGLPLRPLQSGFYVLQYRNGNCEVLNDLIQCLVVKLPLLACRSRRRSEGRVYVAPQEASFRFWRMGGFWEYHRI